MKFLVAKISYLSPGNMTIAGRGILLVLPYIKVKGNIPLITCREGPEGE